MPQHGLSCPDHAENSHASRFPVPRKDGHGLPIHSLHKMLNLLAVSTLLTYSDTTLAHSQRQARGSTANGKVNIWTRTRHRTEIPFKIEKSYINSLYLSPFKVHYKSCLKTIAIRAGSIHSSAMAGIISFSSRSGNVSSANPCIYSSG